MITPKKNEATNKGSSFHPVIFEKRNPKKTAPIDAGIKLYRNHEICITSVILSSPISSEEMAPYKGVVLNSNKGLRPFEKLNLERGD